MGQEYSSTISLIVFRSLFPAIFSVCLFVCLFVFTWSSFASSSLGYGGVDAVDVGAAGVDVVGVGGVQREVWNYIKDVSLHFVLCISRTIA